MADCQSYDNMGNGEYQQDMDDFQQDQQDDGGAGDAMMTNADSGSAEKPGRDDDRKMFVGGLSWETTDTQLREYFTKFGDIESINVKTDPNTGRSRGFAFLVFSNPESIDKILCAGEHIISGKKVDPKKAKARTGKIFVGGLVESISEDDLKSYFSQYGTIALVEMPFDKQRNVRKNFCFITFESDQVIHNILKNPKQTINGHEVDVKRATPKPDGMGMPFGGRGRGRGGDRGGRGGRGRGRGGFGGGNSYSESNYSVDPYYGGYDYSGGYGAGYGYNSYDYSGYGSGGYGAQGGGYMAGKQRGTNGGGRKPRHTPY